MTRHLRSAPETSVAEPPARGPLSVLVIENDGDTAETTALLLQMNGFAVAIAATGEAALLAADGRAFDVAILDVRLGDGMDGCEVARRLRDRPTAKRPLLIAVTASGRDEDRRRTAAAGIDLHLVKPADPEDLVAVLNRFARVLEG